MTHTIKVTAILGKTLNSRDEAIRLFAGIKKDSPRITELVFDFEDVDFMSRSFADQFHKEKNLLLKNYYNVAVNLKNTTNQIIEILNAVAQTQNLKERKFKNSEWLSFSRAEQLAQYLLAI